MTLLERVRFPPPALPPLFPPLTGPGKRVQFTCEGAQAPPEKAAEYRKQILDVLGTPAVLLVLSTFNECVLSRECSVDLVLKTAEGLAQLFALIVMIPLAYKWFSESGQGKPIKQQRTKEV